VGHWAVSYDTFLTEKVKRETEIIYDWRLNNNQFHRTDIRMSGMRG